MYQQGYVQPVYQQRTNTQRAMIQPMMIEHQMILQSTFGMSDVSFVGLPSFTVIEFLFMNIH